MARLVVFTIALFLVTALKIAAQDGSRGESLSQQRPEARFPRFLDPESGAVFVDGKKCGFVHITKRRDAKAGCYVVASVMRISLAATEDYDAETYRLSIERRYADRAPYRLLSGFEELEAFGETERYELRADPTRLVKWVEGEEVVEPVSTSEVLIAPEVLAVGDSRDLKTGFQFRMDELDFETGRDSHNTVVLKESVSIAKAADPNDNQTRLTFGYTMAIGDNRHVPVTLITNGDFQFVEEQWGRRFKVVAQSRAQAEQNIKKVEVDDFLNALENVNTMDEEAARRIIENPGLRRLRDRRRQARERRKNRRWPFILTIGVVAWLISRRRRSA